MNLVRFLRLIFFRMPRLHTISRRKERISVKTGQVSWRKDLKRTRYIFYFYLEFNLAVIQGCW